MKTIAIAFQLRIVDVHSQVPRFKVGALADQQVRAVSQIDPRLAEAAQLGFSRCVLPKGNRARVCKGGLELCEVANVGAAMDALFA